MKLIWACVYCVQLIGAPLTGSTAPAGESSVPAVQDVRVEGSDVIIELSQLMPYKTSSMTSPWRLIIEIPGTLYKTGFSKKDLNTLLVRRVRGYQFKETPLVSRVVVDLNAPVDYKSSNVDNSIVINFRKNEALESQQKKEAAGKEKSMLGQRRRDLLNSLPKEIVTLDFEGADIRDVVRLMSETSNINIIYGPEVAGTITIHLKQVPFDEAFNTILNLKGFVASQLGSNILRVTTPEILQKEQSKAVVFTKTIPVNYIKAQEMQKHIQSIMSSAGRRGNITIAEETNSLVVTDTQDGLAQAERLIAQIDKKPAQVMIEARIVEINLNNGLDVGVQWEYAKQNFKTDASGATEKATTFGLLDRSGGSRISQTGTFSGSGEESIGAIGPGQAGTGVNLPGPASAAITFGIVKNLSAFSATLSALVNQSRAKILAAPKVVTINGKEARIQAVQDIPFRTAAVSASGAVAESFTTVSAGIILAVTPTINAEDKITLKIAPESSFPTADSTPAGPIIRTRKAETTVIVKDGDTLVIGGLIDDQDSKGVSKVPLLGDIPIIGIFFRSNTSRKIRNELLIFVTPRIIRE